MKGRRDESSGEKTIYIHERKWETKEMENDIGRKVSKARKLKRESEQINTN